MIKRHFSILICWLFTISLSAQVSIKGVVFENSTGMPLDFAGVVLYKNDVPAYSTSTATDGSFLFQKVENGNYSLRISFLGYREISKKISITGKIAEVDLGKFSLSEDSQLLQEFEVVAQGPQMRFELDKKVFSVDQNIASAGGSVTDVLQNIPSVAVDNDGNVSLRNNSNVSIWINGRPAGLTDDNQAQILEQMAAGGVESVEIITNPSAKYSPEGSAGIINLVMKKDRKAGFFGSVTGGLNYPVGADYPGGQLGLNLNFNKGKWDGYFNINYRSNKRGSDSKTDRYYLEPTEQDTLYSMFQNSESNRSMYGLMSRFGLNYQLNDKNVLGVSGAYTTGGNESKTNMDYRQENGIDTDKQMAYHRKNSSNGDREMFNVVATHGIQFDKRHDLQTSLQYTQSENDNESNYLQTALEGNARNMNQQQRNLSSDDRLEFKSDFTKHIGKDTKWEAGVNIRRQDRSTKASGSENNIYIFEMDNNFDYSEQLYAVYTTYGSRFGNLSIQGGLRGEYIIIENSTNGKANPRKEYFQPFPSVYVSYTLPKDNELQFNYTRRINRPRGRQLNAFRDVSDSTNISYGNSDLEPEFTSSFELNHIKSWKKQVLSSSLYYKHTTNIIQSVRFLDENEVMNSTYMNTSESQSAGLEIVSKTTFTNALSLTTTVNGFYFNLIGTDFVAPTGQSIEIEGRSNLSWNGKLMLNAMFSKTFSGQLTGNYMSPRAVNQGKIGHQYSVDLGLRKTFFDKKLSSAFTVRDIFNSRKMSNTTEGIDFIQYTKNNPYGPTFNLSVTYNFGHDGNRPKPEKRNRNGNEDGFDEDMMEEF
ncbi:MAG: TonB-dependent receptor [Prevotellaceae bacterium]|jgi:outer membrane receptor protein involved in Fe transport|nr:TonB-dependent receptor [Prevotellaceae bacterium]